MTKAITQNINEILQFKERIFIVLIISIIISSSLYLYFVQSAITNVVSREDIVKKSHVLSASVGELEAKYFQVKNTVDIELAHEKGFKDSEVTSFISNKSLTAITNHNEL